MSYQNSIYGWCAASKVSGLEDYSIDEESMEDIISIAAKQGRSILVASVNIEEKRVIKWLRKHKWKKCPTFRNWGHGGRETFTYMFQIDPKTWLDNGGNRHFGMDSITRRYLENFQ